MKPKQPATLTAEERAAMRELAAERKREARDGAGRAAGEAAVVAAIAAMPEPDRALAARLHAIISAAAPMLVPKTWYGMPAYARDGNVVCYFQGAYKFKARYAMLGFSDKAKLDDGALWPTVFAITELNRAVEARIKALLQQALG